MASVFLSYDRDDADRAGHFAHALEKAGHEVWWDLHVRGGAQFSKVIEEALKAADVVVVLWSKNSIESAWVRDEAAAGRDTGRLVPVTIDGTEAPLGFRQFQTIDLSRWRGRATPQQLKALLADVESMAPPGPDQAPPAPIPHAAATRQRRAPVLAMIAVAVLLLVALGWWTWSGRSALPVVEVAAADQKSRGAASDLFVKLGTLSQVGQGKWELVDASSAPSHPDFIFRTADTGSPADPRASLVLLDGRDQGLLWSREFGSSGTAEADLRQRMSLTAGLVLGCALEAQVSGGLSRDVLKIFLNGCAQMAEESQDRPEIAASSMRAVVTSQRGFVPGWAHLLMADVNVFSNGGTDDQKRQLQQDIRDAIKVAPDLPQITIAQTYLLPTTAFGQSLDLLARAKARAPDNPLVYTEEASALTRVGRMQEAIADAQRAAELDPLSPATETQLIMTLAHGGQLQDARHELDRAQKLWGGTAALRDAQFAFNLRYGDAKIALQLHAWTGLDLYAKARDDPSPQNVEALAAWFRKLEGKATPEIAGSAIQELGEFHRTDDVFRWIATVPTWALAGGADVLFRPTLTDARRDPRFMLVVKRAGLIDYWRSSGRWSDFCSDPQLPYDCKKEAAKLQ